MVLIDLVLLHFGLGGFWFVIVIVGVSESEVSPRLVLGLGTTMLQLELGMQLGREGFWLERLDLDLDYSRAIANSIGTPMGSLHLILL